MAWYDRFLGRKDEEKLNPSQTLIGGEIQGTREPTVSYERQYEELEIVNRAVNMIVDDAAEIPAVITGSARLNGVLKGIKRAKVDTLLNFEPNLFQDINTFKRNLITDFILDGNIFIYFDGVHLYHLPSSKMQIVSSKDTYVEKYTFSKEVDYSPKEIVHIKENSFYSIYRGVPRLSPALRTMQLMASMRKFQDNFFKNGAVPGLVLKSPNTLSEKIPYSTNIYDNLVVLSGLENPSCEFKLKGANEWSSFEYESTQAGQEDQAGYEEADARREPEEEIRPLDAACLPRAETSEGFARHEVRPVWLDQ